jgi:hypothetical protein
MPHPDWYMMELFVVSPAFVDAAWADGASTLAEATKWANREITADQLKMMLGRGERALLGMREGTEKPCAWAAVQVQQLPNIRVLYVYGIVAHNQVAPEQFGKLKDYAKANGCSTIRGVSSDAVGKIWERKLKAKRLYAIYEIEVN